MIPKINNRALMFTMLLVCICASECNSGLRKGITQGPIKESSPEPPSERGKLATDPVSRPVEGMKIWAGRSGGIDIWWTTVDLYYQDDSGVKGVWGTLARKDFKDFDASLREDVRAGEKMMDCDYNREFEVLSVVGPLVSFADYYVDFCRGGAHPGADARFTTIDLKRPGEVLYARGKDASGMDVDLKESGKVIKLTDYFPEEEILRTLLDDAVIKRALATLDSPRKPKTLAELPELFAANDYELGESTYELRPDFLTRFAFHHLEDDNVAVRIGLPPHYGANRAQHMQLGLLLPIPKALKEPLALAAIHQDGFLMRDVSRIANGQVTRFSFTTGKRDKRKK